MHIASFVQQESPKLMILVSPNSDQRLKITGLGFVIDSVHYVYDNILFQDNVSIYVALNSVRNLKSSIT